MLRTFVWCFCVLTFAGCSRLQAVLPSASQMTGTAANAGARPDSSYAVLYRFPGGAAGSEPTGLTVYQNALYGTTIAGGAKTFGTVFMRGVGGKVRVLYSFQGGSDGATPEGALVILNRTFYGTTEYGGTSGDGTVFAVTPAGKEQVVYRFKGGTDGANPILAGLIALNGKLYGTTNAGGDEHCRFHQVLGCGTVFEVSASGQERILHRFRDVPDGALPSGALTVLDGELYGTTNYGGRYGYGSVFSVTTAGKESTLYSFKGYPGGITPLAGLTVVNGSFYGTTALGGAAGYGTVYAIGAGGSEASSYSFKGAPDGAVPYASLTALGTSLYGTTEVGGSSKPSCLGHGLVGCGTVFAFDSSGKLSVIYRFKGHSDGASPWASLVPIGSSLYGTTLLGGNGNSGTIFKVTP